MYRSPRYLEKVDYEQVDLETPLTLPANGQRQNPKTGMKFSVKDRDVVCDWYNAYFRIEYKFQLLANGGNVPADSQSVSINSSSLIKNLSVKFAVYAANDIHKVIFMKNVVEYSDDYAKTVAKDEFWYLDNDNTTVTDGNATNQGIRARALLSQGGTTVKTIVPLNRYLFFEELSDSDATLVRSRAAE